MSVNTVKETTEELLKLLTVEAEVAVTEDEGGVYQVQIETPDQGLLIGYHGETIAALQLVLNLIVSKKLGEWKRVAVNVGDYREQRAEKLQAMANSIVERALAVKQPMAFPALTAGERRVVHLYLQERKDITSASEGEGVNRRLIVRPVIAS